MARRPAEFCRAPRLMNAARLISRRCPVWLVPRGTAGVMGAGGAGVLLRLPDGFGLGGLGGVAWLGRDRRIGVDVLEFGPVALVQPQVQIVEKLLAETLGPLPVRFGQMVQQWLLGPVLKNNLCGHAPPRFLACSTLVPHAVC